MTSPTRTAPTGGRHGRSTYVHHGCRCLPCRHAMAAYKTARDRQIAYGRWQQRVPAEPARRHVQALTATGYTWDQSAHAAGVTRAVIRGLLVGAAGRPPTRGLSPATARAIISVPLPVGGLAADGKALVDAVGSRRRLQALRCAGWPLRTLIATAGMSREQADARLYFDILHERVLSITAWRAAAIRHLYDLYWDQQPAAHGARPQDIRAAANAATASRWAPAAAWDDDDIDNPAALPDWTGRCGTPGGYYDHTVLGTPTCQPCRDAVAVAAAGRKLRRRERATNSTV
ncbi:hypothetical protein ACGFZP_12810 [Kitasatospora sp. NPDC048239]|uniref:hypothetical protein n=1 Tax=Kitasatospora sp. NPDC048239 TaxID=3364046 RepID=UPI003717242A